MWRLLLRRSLPRVEMSLILAATGVAGFVASFAMLHLGVWRMRIRYPLAVLFAYAVFIVLLYGQLRLSSLPLNSPSVPQPRRDAVHGGGERIVQLLRLLARALAA